MSRQQPFMQVSNGVSKHTLDEFLKPNFFIILKDNTESISASSRQVAVAEGSLTCGCASLKAPAAARSIRVA